jgi:hypothetical protein
MPICHDNLGLRPSLAMQITQSAGEEVLRPLAGGHFSRRWFFRIGQPDAAPHMKYIVDGVMNATLRPLPPLPACPPPLYGEASSLLAIGRGAGRQLLGTYVPSPSSLM